VCLHAISTSLTLSPDSSTFRMTDLLQFAFENNKELLAPLG